MGLKITNTNGERPAIALYGTIGDDFGGVTADMVRSALSEIPRNRAFDFHIYSDGGSFDEAMAIHSLIASRGKKSRGIVDGLAASAASLLLQGTGERVMSQHSRQMIHQAHGRTLAFMTADQFRTMAEQLDAINREITTIYSSKWAGSEAELQAALSQDFWMNAEESVERGLADRVGESMAIAARVNRDYFDYNNVPEDVIVESGPFIPPWKAEFEEKLAKAIA